MIKYSIIIFSLLILASCGKDQMTTDDELIQEYLANNGLQAKLFESGLYVIVDIEGGSEKPDLTSEVTIDYEGKYLDGEKFDSSYDSGEPIIFPLNGFIEGWQLGIPEFGKGGSGTLIIPSHLGYGGNPPFGIRKNAVLIFDIELLDFI